MSGNIARSSYEYQKRIESSDQVVVGLNQYQSDNNQPLELFQFDPEEEDWQKKRLADVKNARSQSDVTDSLHAVTKGAKNDENLMPLIISAVEVSATEGELMDALRDVYGEYVDPGVF